MTQLSVLHQGLRHVRRYRAAERWTRGTCLLICTMLGAMLLEFGLDVWVSMGRMERALLLVAMAVLLGWSFRRFIRPILGVREDDTTLALLVERNQTIDSDLVAALQFAQPGRTHLGSNDLRQAVVEYVAELAPSLNFMEGFAIRRLLRPVGLAAATLLVWVLLIVIVPSHVRAFSNRLFLGNDSYPTRTRIVRVIRPTPRAAMGQPVAFEIEAAGELPETGTVMLRNVASDAFTAITLQHDLDQPGLYTAQFERLLEEVEYTIQIGDATLDPRTLELIPRPTVELDMHVSTPSYAGTFANPTGERGYRRVVLEGSSVALTVKADKPLRSATLTLGDSTHAMTMVGDVFVLAGPHSPLANVTTTLHGEVQVVDDDGLSLDPPLRIMLNVTPDRIPRVRASPITRVVLPDAQPSLQYEVVDDFGLNQLSLHLAVTRATPEPAAAQPAPDGQDAAAPKPQEEVRQEIARVEDHAMAARGTFAIALAPLQLAKGDQVAVTLEALDWRGDTPGKAARSETLILEVSDREGVLATMDELDEQMGRRLDEIIQAQLGTGGRP